MKIRVSGIDTGSRLELKGQLLRFGLQGLFLNLVGYVIFLLLFILGNLGAMLSALVSALFVVPLSAILQAKFVFRQSAPLLGKRSGVLLTLMCCSVLSVHLVERFSTFNVAAFQALNLVFWAAVSFVLGRVIK